MFEFWLLLYFSGLCSLLWMAAKTTIIEDAIADADVCLKVAWCQFMVAASFGEKPYTITVIRKGEVVDEINIGGKPWVTRKKALTIYSGDLAT